MEEGGRGRWCRGCKVECDPEVYSECHLPFGIYTSSVEGGIDLQ